MKILKWLKENRVLVIIMLISLFLRLYKLDYQSFWCDEILTMIHTVPDLTFDQTYKSVLGLEYIPHFYFYLLKSFFILTSYSTYSARLFSVFVGLLCNMIIYFFVKKMKGKEAGLIAALLLSVNLFHIAYSQEARPYCLMVLFILLSYNSVWIFLKNQNLKNAMILGIFCGLIPNAHLIGFLNTGSIFFSILLLIILEKNRQKRWRLFKFSVISGLISIIVISLVYSIMTRTSSMDSFWAPYPNLDNIKGVFLDVAGKSKILLVLNLLICITYFSHNIFTFNIKNKNKTISFIIISVWFILNIGTIIIKSYLGSSLIVSRYFIGVLPLFIIMTTYTILLISNKIIRFTILFSIVVFSIYNIFYQQEYYTKFTKTQFEPLFKEIVIKNKASDNLISEYGWLLTPYLKTHNIKNIETATLDDYVLSMKSKAVNLSSFWYINGNNHPFKINNETQYYLDKNFTLDYDLKNYYDCWAKHYILNKNISSSPDKSTTNEINLYLNEFTNYINDGTGNCYIFENSTLKSKSIELEKGKYKLIINANSLPLKPVEGLNAHILLNIGNNQIGSYFLDEKRKNEQKELTFLISKKQEYNLTIQFDNDVSIGKLDRNVIIYSVKIIRLKNSL